MTNPQERSRKHVRNQASAVAATPQNRPKQEIWNIFFILPVPETPVQGHHDFRFNSANAYMLANSRHGTQRR
jgi:hypothetical protein